MWKFILKLLLKVISISRRLDRIELALTQQGGTLLAALDDLKAKVAAVAGKLDEVKADVADLISKLPAAGGLTSNEVEALKADLDALVAKAEDVADDHSA